MADLVIERFCFSPDGTFGKMMVDGAEIYTVERPWLNNLPSISCIPNGLYVCKPRRFFRGGYDAIEVTNVPGRSHILFHRANAPYEVKGCIAPNAELGAWADVWVGKFSAQAFDRLMDSFGDKEFTLSIIASMGGCITQT